MHTLFAFQVTEDLDWDLDLWTRTWILRTWTSSLEDDLTTSLLLTYSAVQICGFSGPISTNVTPLLHNLTQMNCDRKIFVPFEL